MFSIREKINNLIFIAREKTSPYVYSYFLPLLSALVALLFWIANLQLIGATIVILMACFVLVVYDDFLPVIPFLFTVPMCFRDSVNLYAESLALGIIIFIPLVISIVFHFVKYPFSVKLDKFFYTLLSVLGVFLIGGLFTWDFNNYFKAFDLLLMSGVMPLAVHFFFYNKVKLNDNIDYRKYFCFCFICATTLACLQVCYAYFYIKVIGPWPYGRMPGNFCWANSNNIVSLALIAVPLCCYMMLSSKRAWAWFAEIVFLFVTVLLSGSDGGLATLLVFIPFLMYHSYKNAYRSNRKVLFFLYFAIISAGVLIIAYLFLFRFDNFFAYILDSSSGNGRIYPYTLALENFLSQPILGVGFGNGKVSLEAIIHTHNAYGFFHSTLLHILACAGIVGVIVYAIYYVVRVKYLAKGDTLLSKYAIFSFFLFASYAMVDTSEFNIVLMFMTTIITVVGLINKKGSDDKPLPLYVKIPKF